MNPTSGVYPYGGAGTTVVEDAEIESSFEQALLQQSRVCVSFRVVIDVGDITEVVRRPITMAGIAHCSRGLCSSLLHKQAQWRPAIGETAPEIFRVAATSETEIYSPAMRTRRSKIVSVYALAFVLLVIAMLGCQSSSDSEVCGDGVVDAQEVCDDGNLVDGDGCSATCLSDESCGNGIIDTGAAEECDDGGTAGGDGCSPSCRLEYCGNQSVDMNEVCDDGNTASGDGCAGDCRSDETCGNGIVDVAVGEACDDGNTADGDGCTSNCALPTCGDGVQDPGEACDDMNTSDGDGCSATCMSNEQCGNGIVDVSAGETCDDGGVVSGDGCSSSCQQEYCGNSVIDPDEVCDDGNLTSGDGCSSNCQSNESCGNGILDQAVGEECDDGNSTSGDGCSSDCHAEYCGNNFVDPLEVCDDGNQVDGDGCSATCASDETCGNGVLDAVAGEECDDGNGLSGDGCNATCKAEYCGNAVLDPGEVCDDGNTQSGDGCSATCHSNETCGNHIFDPQEGCEDGNIQDGDGCTSTCAIEATCGNGLYNLGEECDDGNNVDADGCNEFCLQEVLGWGYSALLENFAYGAYDPDVAVDAQGNGVAVWRQWTGDTYKIYSNSYTPSTKWNNNPSLVSSATNTSTAVRPKVAMSPSGDAIAVWNQAAGTKSSIWASRRPAGGAWGTPQLVETNDVGSAERPQVRFAPNGDAFVVWQQFDATRTDVWANRYVVGSGWGTAQLIESDDAGDAIDPRLAVDPAGNAIVVWAQNDGTRYNIWSNRYTNGSGWGSAQLIENNDLFGAGGVDVQVDSLGTAVAVWSQSDGVYSSIWTNRYIPGTGWGTPELVENIHTGGAGSARVVVDSVGNAVAVWGMSDGTRSNLWANHYSAGVGWGLPQLIETDSSADAQAPRVGSSAAGDAVVVWRHGPSQIFANRYSVATGWGTAGSILSYPSAVSPPEVAVDPNGYAIAVYDYDDGSRQNIVANHLIYYVP